MFQGAGMNVNGPSQTELQNLASLLQQGQLALVEKKSKKILKRFPSALPVYNILSAAQFIQEKFAGAADTLEKALSIYPNFVDGEYNLALAYIKLNRIEEAIERLNSVVRKKPNMADAYNNLGAMYLKMSNFELAVENYEKAVELDPGLIPALRNLGAALRELGNIDKAIELLKSALELDPEFNDAHYDLGSIYQEQKEWDNAVSEFRKAGGAHSEIRALETLLLAGRENEVLSGLNRLSKDEPKNRRAAALSCFVSNQYETENTHPFCRNPLDFVSVRKPTIRKGSDRFFVDLMKAADRLTELWEQNTTHGGFQTHGNLFDPAWKHEAFTRLEQIIREELQSYKTEHAGSNELYVSQFPERYRIEGWRVKLMKSGYQGSHIHPDGWVSGVFYLKMPKKLKGNEGAIAFSLHGYNYPILRSDIPTKEHQPSVGELVFFPSSLFHRTVPFESDEERQCIAFDIIPEID